MWLFENPRIVSIITARNRNPRYPDNQGKLPYRAKALFAFQRIDGVDVCFFGLHIQVYKFTHFRLIFQLNKRRINEMKKQLVSLPKGLLLAVLWFVTLSDSKPFRSTVATVRLPIRGVYTSRTWTRLTTSNHASSVPRSTSIPLTSKNTFLQLSKAWLFNNSCINLGSGPPIPSQHWGPIGCFFGVLRV